MSEFEREPLRTLQVLVVGDDPRLEDELREAFEASTDARVTLQGCVDYPEAERAARARCPDLVCVQLDGSATELQHFVASLRSLSPEMPFLGARQPAAAHGESSDILIEAVRAGFLDVIDRPLSSTDLRRLLPRIAASAQSQQSQGRVVVFHSTKGGVGKSTLSVNVACGLAQAAPDRVLLIDASLQLGVCAAALDLEGKSTLADAAREMDRLDETLLRQLAEPHPSGLRVLAAPRGPVDAADVDEEALARIVSIARRAFDTVVIDTLPIVDGAMLTLLDFADRLYLVNQGTVPDVIGAAQLLETLDELGIGADRRTIVLNRNMPRFAGELSAAEVGERLGQAVDHEIPHDKRVLTALNVGEPLVLKSRGRFGWGRALRGVIDDVQRSTPAPSAPAGAEPEEGQAEGFWRPAEVER